MKKAENAVEFFYVLPENIFGDRLEITGDEAHHLSRVLRKKEDEAIVAVDGKGNAFFCTIVSSAGARIAASIGQKISGYHESSVKISVGIAPLKNPSRTEWCIEKCTELGAAEIILLCTEHSESFSVKEQRWNQLAAAAMKQSQRSCFPVIHAPEDVQMVLQKRNSYDLALIAHEKTADEKTLASVLAKTKSWKSGIILIGPEGGFSQKEVEEAERLGWDPVSLGERRLRSETAAVLAAGLMISAVQARSGRC